MYTEFLHESYGKFITSGQYKLGVRVGEWVIINEKGINMYYII
jgi:hypothetical protein